MIDFSVPPPRLSSAERQIFWLATILVAATRLLAIARTPWDWDEILFSLGMRDFDVVKHHPHPPGFPLFIALAKVIRVVAPTDFRALQAINVIAAMLILPATFFLCRELRLRFGLSLTSAVLLAFLPNVWFFGGTGFSDVPSMVLSVAAAGTLLRGTRSSRAYLAGAVLLAVAVGFRPQNLLIGGVAAAIASAYQLRARKPALVGAAVVLGGAIVAASYGGAAAATGEWSWYATAIRVHREYIAAHDSYLSPTRPSLRAVADDFFIRPFRANEISVVIALLVAASLITALVRMRWPLLILFASFLPFWILAWLTLDYHSASRFSIAWMPLVAIAAADAVWLIRGRAVAVALSCGLVLAVGIWTWPALAVVRREASPPMQAVDWIRSNAARDTKLYVHQSMGPYVEYFLPAYDFEVVAGPPLSRLSARPAMYLTERQTEARPGLQFQFERGRLWNIVRRRYFDVRAVPLTGRSRFVQGWYDEEADGHFNWVWMGGRSVTELAPLRRPARLTMTLAAPGRGLSGPSSVSITLNGTSLGRATVAAAGVELSWDVARPLADRANVLVIETDRVVNPLAAGISSDARDLGLRLEKLEWSSTDP